MVSAQISTRITKRTKRNGKISIGSLVHSQNSQFETLVESIQNFYSQSIIEKIQKVKEKFPKKIKELEKELSTQTPEEQIRTDNEIRKLKALRIEYREEIRQQQQHNEQALSNISGNLFKETASHRGLEVMLGSLMINYNDHPENFSERIASNKKNKRLFSSGITTLFLDSLIKQNHSLEDKFVNKILDSKEGIDELGTLRIPQQLQEMVYQSIYLQYLGYQSPPAQNFLNCMLNDELTPEQRIDYLNISQNSALIFGKLGVNHIGKVNTHQDLKKKMEHEINPRLNFLKRTISLDQNTQISQIFKICQIYSSFLIPDRERHDRNSHILAYDVMKSLAKQGKIDEKLTTKFLKMVGKFPIGTGIYYLNPSNGNPEKAVVVKTNPEKPNSPICRPVTKNALYHSYHTEIEISPEINLYYESTQKEININQFSSQYWGSPERKGEFFWFPNMTIDKNTKFQSDKIWKLSNLLE